MILLLFLSPIIKCNQVRKVSSKVDIIVDHSSSITQAKGFSKSNFIAQVAKVEKELSQKGYEVSLKNLYNEDISLDTLNWNIKTTNIFNSVQDRLDLRLDENLSHLIVLTDGNYNEGNNPMFVPNAKFVKIHSLVIGDSSPISDAHVFNVDYSKFILSDERNEVITQIGVNKAKGSEIKVRLEYLNGKRIAEKSIRVNTDAYSESMRFYLEGLSKGKHHLRIQISALTNEINLRNNISEFQVEVVDGQKKVHLYYSSPHPDITCIKSLLNPNRAFTLIPISDNKYRQGADLNIFYQIPHQNLGGKHLVEAGIAERIPSLFILGTQSSYSSINQLDLGFKVDVISPSLQEIFPIHNQDFNSFYFKENYHSQFNALPPLNNQIIQLQTKGEISSLLTSKMGNVMTNRSLIGFVDYNGQRMGIIAGENLWRWKMMNYVSQKNHDLSQELFEKIANYLTINREKRQLVSEASALTYFENEQVRINANTYNELYQQTPASKIECQILKNNTIVYSNEMLYNGGNYHVLPRGLGQGLYEYKIKAVIAGKEFRTEGNFRVQSESVEDVYMPANFSDMRLMTAKNNGKIFPFREAYKLVAEISKEEAKSILWNENRSSSALDSVYILVLALLLLSIEWLLRKYLGMS